MKVVADIGGAVGAALIENPYVAAALVAGACVYGAYKAGEAAIEALPGIYDNIVATVSDAYDMAADQVQSLFKPEEPAILTLDNGRTMTLPRGARIIHIPIRAAGEADDIVQRIHDAAGPDAVILGFPRATKAAPDPFTEIKVRHIAPPVRPCPDDQPCNCETVYDRHGIPAPACEVSLDAGFA